jgi:serine/threonine protein kinase
MELLNQGTYGCIYKPGITCNIKPQSPKYTTKIHVKNASSRSVSSNEAAIGEIIRTKIPNYQHYYSPVLETCPVNLAKVAKDDIDQCEFIHKDILTGKPLEYIASKLKYIEGVTLDEYVSKHPTPEIVEHLHKALMNSVKKLASIGIVHFDIKENNVIVKNNGTPIIIDFGIAINMNDPDRPMNEIFYAYAPTYEPWCPEIHIISYYVQHPQIKKVTKAKIMDILENRQDSNSQDYADKYDGKTSAYVIKELLKTYKMWDQYAVEKMMTEVSRKYGIVIK